jgi:hypothetical protein
MVTNGTDITDTMTDGERIALIRDLKNLNIIRAATSFTPARLDIMDAASIKKQMDAYSSLYPAVVHVPQQMTEEAKNNFLALEIERLRKDADRLEALLEGRLIQWDNKELVKF